MSSKKLASLIAHGLVQQSLALSYMCFLGSEYFFSTTKADLGYEMKLEALTALLTFLVGLWHTLGSLYELIPFIRPTYWVRILSTIVFLVVTRLENNIWKWFAILQLLGGIWSALLGAVKREPHQWVVSQRWGIEWRAHLVTATSIFVSSVVLLLILLTPGRDNIQLFGSSLPYNSSLAWLFVQCGMLSFYQIIAARYRLQELLRAGALSLVIVVLLVLLLPPMPTNPIAIGGLVTWALLGFVFYLRRTVFSASRALTQN